MNILCLAQKAINIIKGKCQLPSKGILAGGSLANLIWEQVSGKKAIINDIHVFIFETLISKVEVVDSLYFDPDKKNIIHTLVSNNRKRLFWRSQERFFWQDYWGHHQGIRNKNFYLIEKTENTGLLNLISYSANTEDMNLIIDSFDINCTQIGYDIESERFYWTKDFEEFLKTGDLKLTNLGSPAHSSIRLIKKREELGAKLDELQLKILAHVISERLIGITRSYFSDKYHALFQKYSDELSKYFKILRDENITQLIRHSSGKNINIWTLESHNSINLPDKDILRGIYHCDDILFYFNNVWGDQFKSTVWKKLNSIYKYDNYIDYKPNPEDIILLNKIITDLPGSIRNLEGLKISQQIALINNLFDSFKEDPTIALVLLETKKLDHNSNFDEGERLLLELQVRKEILSDKYSKILKNLESEKLLSHK